MRLVLASASARRRDLLAAAGLAFDVVPAEVDERPVAGEPPDRYVARLAREKARAVAARCPGRPVLGADTEVVVDGEVLGKPADAGEAAAMLRRLAGRAHEVLTGVCLIHGASERATVARTAVWMTPIPEAGIAGYVATGEPLDKAGGYAIQGRAARFIARIDGPYDNVVGLPMASVLLLLRAEGLADPG